MNIEIVLKLKECGFSFKEGSFRMIPNPTLSDLIKECGKDLNVLEQIKDGAYDDGRMMWCAHNINHMRCGITPEEAVANLYIALHEKRT